MDHQTVKNNQTKEEVFEQEQPVVSEPSKKDFDKLPGWLIVSIICYLVILTVIRNNL